MKKFLFSALMLLSSLAFAAEPISLAPIVVSATKYSVNSYDLPMSVSVVDSETIDGSFHLTPAASLYRLPGLSISDNFSSDLRISSRGYGAKAPFATRGIKLYQDGIPISSPDGFGSTSLVDMSNVGNIEFLNGPFTSMYGSNSGGVMQFFTKVPTEANKVEGTFLVGSFNTQEKGVKYSGIEGDMKYLLSHSDYSTDGYRDYSKLDRKQDTAKIWLDVSPVTNLQVTINNFDQKSNDYGNGNGGITQKRLDTNPTSVEDAVYNIASWKNLTQTDASIKVNHFINHTNSFTMSVYGGVRSAEQLNPTTEAATLKTTTSSLLNTDRQFYGAEASWLNVGYVAGLPYKTSFGLSSGVSEDKKQQHKWMKDGKLVTGNILSKDDTQRAISFDQYVQGELGLTNTIDVHAGIRRATTKLEFIDHMTDSANNGDNGGKTYYQSVNPVIGVNWKALEDTNLYANYGKGVEIPSFVEAQSASAVATTGPNTTLNQSRADNFEVGVKTFAIPNSYATLALYQSNTKDEIVIGQNVPGFKIYENKGKTTRKGLEASIDSKLPLGFEAYGMYTYIDATFDETGNKIPGVANDNLFGELSWKYNPINLKLSGEVIHSGKTYANVENTVSADAYTIYNLKASLKQNVNGWTFNEYAALTNVTDEVYVTSVRIAAPYDRFFETGAPRGWMVGTNVGYSF